MSPQAQAKTILFVGNSFTSGLDRTAIKEYAPDSVTDLNGTGVGGVPAIFKTFSEEMGLDYQVSVETVDGRGLDFHYDNDLAIFQRPWDAVVLQDLSMLDKYAPGSPERLISYSKQICDVLRVYNPKVALYLDATWSSARLTYGRHQPWYGKPIGQMAQDVYQGYVMAARNIAPAVVIPVGLAWNRAMEEQVAIDDPDDIFAFSELNLWAHDGHHGSIYGYYLEALVIFGCVTGIDPLALGAEERAAKSLDIESDDAARLQRVAHDELAANR
jgi:hypothetical protein